MDRITAAQVFVDVARSGSFTATAHRLSMSRAMVTRYVEAMESWFDARLLHRTTRKVTLTTVGEQCLEEVENWLDTAFELVSKVKSSESLTGKIRIATSMSLAHAQLMRPISLFIKKHPQIKIDIDVQDNTTDLINSRIDLAIRIASSPDLSLIGKPIAICRSVIVASENYLKSMPQITIPQDLTQHQCLSHSNFEKEIWHLNRDHDHQAISINSRLTANDATILLDAVCCDAGIAMQPTYLVNSLIKQNKLVSVLPDWSPSEMNIYALYSSRKFLSPTVRALIDYLTEYFIDKAWD